MKYNIETWPGGLGQALIDYHGNVPLEECDIFINCKHETQFELLYKAAELKKRIINIGSHASDYTHRDRYAVEKKALREANHQLFSNGINTTIINFGYFDSPRTEKRTDKKMSIEYCCYIINWILQQPHRIKEITVCE